MADGQSLVQAGGHVQLPPASWQTPWVPGEVCVVQTGRPRHAREATGLVAAAVPQVQQHMLVATWGSLLCTWLL